tara:strand:+ start:57 stop:566 length:510 start_codon:yes stop_codon:yes gene_type:complete
MEQELNFKTLCQMTTNMLELPEGSLAYKSRREELQIPRMVVSVVSKMIDNTHFNIIASGINRDRTLINYYMKMHKSNYRSFPKYRDMFNKIYNAYKDIQGAKRTFADKYHLREHLRQGGVRHSTNPQTTIRVKSGKVKIDIKVSYRDFSNQLELCKLALTDCNYNINIL